MGKKRLTEDGTLFNLTNDGLDIPKEIIDNKDRFSFLVKAIIETGGWVLANGVWNFKTRDLLSNDSGIFDSDGTNILKNIERYLNRFKTYLELRHNGKGGANDGDNSIKYSQNLTIRKLGYELFFSWLNYLLNSCGVKSSRIKQSEPEFINEVKNILEGEVELSSLLIFLTECGFLEESKNPGNDFEVESEVKILEVDKEHLVSELKKLGADVVFEGEVLDTYYDFADRRLDNYKKTGTNRSFRIREKVSNGAISQFYTIKRKINGDESGEDFRKCFEKELKINSFQSVVQILERFGLNEIRRKKKKRISLFLPDQKNKNIGVKFDIDDYEDVVIDGKEVLIPTVLEIETNSQLLADYYVDRLGLSSNKRLICGSRGLFTHYEKANKPKKK